MSHILILLCTGVALGGGDGAVKVAVTMDTVPVYLRGGYIVPRKERPRRSTAAMAADPLTLVCPPPAPPPFIEYNIRPRVLSSWLCPGIRLHDSMNVYSPAKCTLGGPSNVE